MLLGFGSLSALLQRSTFVVTSLLPFVDLGCDVVAQLFKPTLRQLDPRIQRLDMVFQQVRRHVALSTTRTLSPIFLTKAEVVQILALRELRAERPSTDTTDFEAVVIPGGYAPDFLRRDPKVLQLVRDFDNAGKPVAFICHAGWVPISAGILKGRRATSVSAIKDDMVNAGVDFVDEPTVVDGNLISARVPDDMGPWMQSLLQAIEKA